MSTINSSYRDDEDLDEAYSDHHQQQDNERDDDKLVSPLVDADAEMDEDFAEITHMTTIQDQVSDFVRRNMLFSSLGFVLVFVCLIFAAKNNDGSNNYVAPPSAKEWRDDGGGSGWRLRNKHHTNGARPGTGGFNEPGYKQSPNRLSPKYLFRTHLSKEERKELATKWGEWKFVDAKAKKRPTDDYYANYPNRDVPRSAFPSNAWQLDTEFLSNFLDESIKLVERSMEAILGEYGHSKFDQPNLDFEERSKMFHVNIVDIANQEYMSQLKHDITDSAGWMFSNGWSGLQRRILHAILTQDSFTYLMGGHSSAAGHGNHFWQSYTLQMGKIIEPVFARLGVFFRAHNVGMGGLGTAHNAMGAKDIYGTEIDILDWDSEMTEKNPFVEYFLRAGLVSGNRVPVIWNSVAGDFARNFALETGADLGNIVGEAMAGIEKMTSIVDADNLPWAARFLHCDGEIKDGCLSNANKYNTKCWIERDDFSPNHQNSEVSGQASWHPGWRWHQLLGRTQAFTLLRATHAALTQWQNADGYVLPDEAWHVTNHYEAIRSKVTSTATCEEMNIHPLFCTRPINSRTEFTPRALGYQSSIRSIMKGDSVPKTRPNVYDPPDVEYSFADPPIGEVNSLQVIENGHEFTVNLARKKHVDMLANASPIEFKSKDFMPPGRGLALIDTPAASDNCDGTYDSWCNRGAEESCLLHHHNDGRGGMAFDGLSGWLVMNLANVQEGFIAIKMELWRSGGSPATENWTCENNVCDSEAGGTHGDRLLQASGSYGTMQRPDDVRNGPARSLGGAKVPQPCPDYKFQFAVDGEITTWDAETFKANKVSVQRVVDVFQLVDNKNMTHGEPRDVELAIRLTGCDRLLTYSLTHVYWA
ncbi:hypothetical protein MPSEU_000788600 [Mayamaea pseudoterrestris]|nr:hypothetical protein MPSEU_000788600 [Mayamaea pseudoterrestris]